MDATSFSPFKCASSFFAQDCFFFLPLLQIDQDHWGQTPHGIFYNDSFFLDVVVLLLVYYILRLLILLLLVFFSGGG